MFSHLSSASLFNPIGFFKMCTHLNFGKMMHGLSIDFWPIQFLAVLLLAFLCGFVFVLRRNIFN